MAALVWALAAGSAALWWLHFPRQQRVQDAPLSLTPVVPVGQGTAWMARTLGHTSATAIAADEQRRFQLLGVIAAPSGQGSALLIVDGQAPQAFVQGQMVVDGWRLQSVGKEDVRLSAGAEGASLELALPERP